VASQPHFPQRLVRPPADDVGLPGLTPHELRHTAASLAVRRRNVKAIQRMLGHASAAVTLDVCSDLFDDDLDAVAAALNQAALRSSVRTLWERSPETASGPAVRTKKPPDDRRVSRRDPSGI
jgi:integrase